VERIIVNAEVAKKSPLLNVRVEIRRQEDAEAGILMRENKK
jgi:hypothetical protein